MSAKHTPGHNAFSRWGMFTAPQGSIVTNCYAHTVRCASMLNWHAPSSPACGAYQNDECDAFGAATVKATGSAS